MCPVPLAVALLLPWNPSLWLLHTAAHLVPCHVAAEELFIVYLALWEVVPLLCVLQQLHCVDADVAMC